MKVLFLDIDGVCNCMFTPQRVKGYYLGIDPAMAKRVRQIRDETQCSVVLSSTWRTDPELEQEVIDKVCNIIGSTPEISLHDRGKEVEAWLKDHPEVERYAILDDNDWFLPEQPLFKTTNILGLTDEIAQKVIDYLNKDSE